MFRRTILIASAALLALVGCGDDDDSGTAPGPRGDFSVLTSSSGVELDADGYEIRVNDIFSGLIGVNDTVEFVNRAADTYVVELTEVAANCTVQGNNPREVLVVADSGTETTFVVECIGTDGVLRVVTITSGLNPDDGYTLAVDEMEAGTIGANDTASTADLDTGEHTVRLGDIALNCRLAGDPLRVVDVPSDDTVETNYEVFCTDQVGLVRIVTSTTGVLLDPDGYQFTIEFGDPLDVGTTDVRTVSGVAAGINRVTVLESSVADNCSVTGENPRTVDVPAGSLVSTTFDVSCGVP
jgi:hypothetical protein